MNEIIPDNLHCIEQCRGSELKEDGKSVLVASKTL